MRGLDDELAARRDLVAHQELEDAAGTLGILEAHSAQLPKYTDADMHNVLAYLQTLK